ncbi:MAG: NAD(P)H-hydrate dehydratase, partial [Thermoanaerobaculales bacterium]|nr:NAD(P)H-hydrate dehydratase [Thermoanaerobaculales bacterium]
MLPVLDNEAMREADRHTIEDLGVPSLELMENAAAGVVDALRDSFPDVRRILILCGRGNNGGDGLAAARILAGGGLEIKVLLFGDPENLSPDGSENLHLAEKAGVPIAVVEGDDLSALDGELEPTPPDLVVDALLGTGIDRPLGGRLAEVVRRVEEADLPVIAVDVPTGLSGSSAGVPGPVMPAELTVTFAALKRCHVLPPACLHCGEVAVVDIGIPTAVLESGSELRWIEAEDVALLLPQRHAASHKGSYGHLLLVAGAEGRGGAVAMAAQAAVVAGSGLVTMAVPKPAVPVVDGACLEAMTHAMAADDRGQMAGPEGLDELLDRMTAIATGPGMGTGDGAAATLEWILDTWQGSLLLDADAINLLAGRPERLAGREQSPVLTPHPGELARLLGRKTEDVVSDRVAAAREAAERAQAVVVAKGFRTVIADPDGEVFINPTGDAGLASGGSGDILTGTIGAFLAQGL